MKVGAQLYTVRDFCKTPADFAETLKKIAGIGYTTVQVSGTCDYTPVWLKEQLDKTGLKCVITHTPAARIKDEPVAVCLEHDVFDCKYVGLGWYGHNESSPYEQFVKDYKPAAAAIRDCGKYFMYHNHNHEFRKIGKKTILQQMSEDFPADILGFTLDTYWIQVGGGDPAQWIHDLAGRVPCIHLKDCAYGSVMSVVGEGNINFNRVFEMAEKAGTEYMLVEQDDCNGEDPFECLKRSYEYLKSNGLN